MPRNWGLLYVDIKGKITMEYSPSGYGNIRNTLGGFERDIDAEYKLLYSVLRRAEEAKLIPELFKPIKKKIA